jgi:hypothetical protein
MVVHDLDINSLAVVPSKQIRKRPAAPVERPVTLRESFRAHQAFAGTARDDGYDQIRDCVRI